jgi:hypothetical protein
MRNRYIPLVVLLAVIVIVALVRTLRALRLLYLSSTGPEPICPYCGAKRIRESRAVLARDRLYRIVAFTPYRCRVCFARFYRPLIHAPELVQSRRLQQPVPESYRRSGRSTG